jgi:hypothetical protein
MHLFGVAMYTEILHRNFERVSRRQIRIGNDWRGLLADDDLGENQHEWLVKIGTFTFDSLQEFSCRL